MREHMGLYRGKRTDNGEWVQGYLGRDTIIGGGRTGLAYVIRTVPKKLFDGSWFEIDPDTVGECTGLTDKNGRLIFEGDIVESWNRRVLKVKFGPHWDEESEWDTYGWYACDEEGALNLGVDWNGHRIIGNIHDNPELLGGGDN